MLDRVLRFKHHLRAEPAGDELVFVYADDAHFLLRGRVYTQVAPLVDGERTVGEILTALDGVAAAHDVYFALRTLEQRGYVIDVSALPRALGLTDRDAGFWHALGSDPAVAAMRVGGPPVELRSVGGADVDPLRAALVDAGLRLAGPGDEGDPTTLGLVAVDDYLDPALGAIDRAARASSRRWLPVRLTGLAPWFGPVFGQPDGPCWTCLAHRLRWNRPIETYLEARGHVRGPTTAPRIALAASMRAAAELAALTLAWWLADGGTGALDEHLLALDLRELRAVKHRIDRRPQCQSCGDAGLVARRAHEPVLLASRPRRFSADGGFRIMTPAETLARCEPLVSPVTGVLASLAPVPGRDAPSRPVWGAVYRVLPTGNAPGFEDFHRLTSGKGVTATQAKASALAEGLERISALFHGDEQVARGRASQVNGALAPPVLQLFSAAQHRDRVAGPGDPKRAVPRAYADDELDWTPAWSLTHGRLHQLPLAYCFQHAPTAADRELVTFNPNGHAAGNCLEEAILQGFLELVERDAVALWWYSRSRLPAVDLDDARLAFAAEQRAHYRGLGWSVWVLDLTSDLGIPAFVALAEREGGGRWSVGFGCHLDARLGVQRALTELNQIFDPDDAAPAPWDAGALTDDGFLRPAAGAPLRRLADFVPMTNLGTDGDLRDDVNVCVQRAAALGLDVLVVDQTRPDLRMSAVKVVVPGLRHFWPRLGPGRLYAAPVALGRLDVALSEHQLNPVPLWL